MSNKTQLQTNNTALDGYIARINAAKDVAASLPEAGGGSGGGSIETCNIIFVSGPSITEQQMQIIATVYENNAIMTVNRTHTVYFDMESGGGSSLNISNVINNTPITLVFETAKPSSSVTLIGSTTYICDIGNTMTFTFTPSDGQYRIRLG